MKRRPRETSRATTPDPRCVDVPPGAMLVPGLPRTAVTADGRVFSWLRSGAWSLRSPHVHPDGHAQLWIDGAGPREVGDLVCRAFHGDPPSREHVVTYADGDYTNASAKNLSWTRQIRRIERRTKTPDATALVDRDRSARVGPWSDAEDQKLAAFYALNRRRPKPRAKLRRNAKSIILRASKLGFLIRGKWSQQELETLKGSYRDATRRTLLELLPHRTLQAIVKKAEVLGLRGDVQGTISRTRAAHALGINPTTLDAITTGVSWHTKMGLVYAPNGARRIAPIDEIARAFAEWSCHETVADIAREVGCSERIAKYRLKCNGGSSSLRVYVRVPIRLHPATWDRLFGITRPSTATYEARVTAVDERAFDALLRAPSTKPSRAEVKARLDSLPRAACPKCERPVAIRYGRLVLHKAQGARGGRCSGSFARVEPVEAAG